MLDWTSYLENARQAGGRDVQGKELEGLQQQYSSDTTREDQLGSVNAYQQGRNPYYSSLYQQLRGAGVGAANSQYNQALKHQQLGAAGKGLSGSTVSMSQQQGLGTQLAGNIANVNAGAQRTVQGIRASDNDYANALKSSLYQTSPYMQSYYASLGDSARQQGATYESQASLDTDAYNIQRQYGNDQSQMYGNMLGNAAQAGTNYLNSKA